MRLIRFRAVTADFPRTPGGGTLLINYELVVTGPLPEDPYIFPRFHEHRFHSSSYVHREPIRDMWNQRTMTDSSPNSRPSSKPKLYECPSCHSKFSRSDHLTRHIRQRE